MARLGMDIEKARAVAQKIEGMAEQVMTLFSQMNNEVQTGFEWDGRDSLRFRSAWETTLQKQFNAVSEMLKADALQLRKEADQQDQASGGGGGTGSH